MDDHSDISAKVKQNVIKGTFKGKYVRRANNINHDEGHKSLTGIEILEGEIITRQDDLLHRVDSSKSGKFSEARDFPIRLPGKINVTLQYLNGDVKHFKIALKQVRLVDYHLSDPDYIKKEIYGTIEGLIVEYALHPDMMAKEIDEDSTPIKRLETNNQPTSSIVVSPHGRLQLLLLFAGITGFGLLIKALLTASWIIMLLGILGIVLLIFWLNNWSSRRYSAGVSRRINTLVTILAVIGLVAYLITFYQEYTIYSSKAETERFVNISDLKNKAEQLINQNNYGEALNVFSQLLEADADDRNAHYNRALCYSQIGKISEAVKDLRSLISKGDSEAIALHNKINPLKKKMVGTVIRCWDGTISYSKNRRGTCSHHGGVKDWEEPVYKEYREY